ncbi:hypothetical protein Taro_041181, partial [Colocasia esculenta]|nr:hypothetical protein [Colocasia esculenta]
WLTGARGKTLVREAELDRAENSGSGGGSREEASGGSSRIEVWRDFLHASEVGTRPLNSLPSPQVVHGRLSRFEELCLSVVGLVLLLFIMAPRRRRERRVVVQTSQQEAGDAPPPPLAQPRPQDTHGGVMPPLPPQATQGFDWTPQLVGGSRPEHWQVLLVARVPDAVAAYLYVAAAEADFLQTQVQVGAAQAQPDLLWRVFLLACGVEFFASGTHVLAYVVWSYRCRCGVAALPCLVQREQNFRELSTGVFLFFAGCRVLKLKNKVISLFCVVGSDAQVVRGRLSRFEELCLSVVGLVLLL